MAKITKKNYTTFVKLLTEALSVYTKDVTTYLDTTTFKVNTIYGKLNIYLRLENNSGVLYTFHSIFEDVEKAKVLGKTVVNQYSGKYNFHYPSEYTPSEAVQCIMETLTPLFRTPEIVNTELIPFIKEAALKNYSNVLVRFNAAYDPSLHSTFNIELKEALHTEKVSIFDISTEVTDIINLFGNKDVKEIYFCD